MNRHPMSNDPWKPREEYFDRNGTLSFEEFDEMWSRFECKERDGPPGRHLPQIDPEPSATRPPVYVHEPSSGYRVGRKELSHSRHLDIDEIRLKCMSIEREICCLLSGLSECRANVSRCHPITDQVELLMSELKAVHSSDGRYIATRISVVENMIKVAYDDFEHSLNMLAEAAAPVRDCENFPASSYAIRESDACEKYSREEVKEMASFYNFIHWESR